MKLLHRLVAYCSSRWSLQPDCQLSCAEQELDRLHYQAENLARQLEQLRHQADHLARWRWL